MRAAHSLTSRRGIEKLSLVGGVALVIVLSVASLFVGTADISVLDVVTGQASDDAVRTLLISRFPRTIAVVLSGAAIAVAGLLMQLLVRNKFVEPGTVGTTESAILGLLVVTIVAPAAPLGVKMLVGAIFALLGTFLFLRILKAIPLREVIMVPLMGIMLSGVVAAISTFIAYERDMLATLSGWQTGSFSGVIAGRYELIWIVAGALVLAYLLANAFTVAGLGEDIATALGVNHRLVMGVGLSIVAVVSAVVVVVAGSLPFLGLVVPNVVSLFLGDYLRRSLPWVALGGAAFVLVADILARTLIAPAEIPIGTIVGVIGGAAFIAILLVKGRKA